MLSNVCQEVDVLPFQIYDRVKRVIERLRRMFTTMDHSACPEKNCQWERYHADILMMNSCDKYMDTSIGNVNIGTSTQTRLTAQTELAIADGTELVKKNCKHLHEDCTMIYPVRYLTGTLKL